MAWSYKHYFKHLRLLDLNFLSLFGISERVVLRNMFNFHLLFASATLLNLKTYFLYIYRSFDMSGVLDPDLSRASR